MAMTSEEKQKKRRQKRLIKGLLLGGAAVGLPALINRFLSKSAPKAKPLQWGRHRFFSWGSGRISYQRLGEGEDPILFLHSLGPGHDGEEWKDVALEVGATHPVLVPDLPGWGRSGHESLYLDPHLYRLFLRDFLRDAVEDPVTLVAAGHSAAYAVQAAIDQPHLVKALVLVTPRGLGRHSVKKNFQDFLVQALIRVPILGTSTLHGYTSRQNLNRYLVQEVFARADRVDATTLDRYFRSSHQIGAYRSLRAWIDGKLLLNVKDLLPQLKIPTTITWGRYAVNPPVENADLWLHHIEGAKIEIFEDSGLLPHVEEPKAFASMLAGVSETN